MDVVATNGIEIPEPDLTPDDMIKRAKAMGPALRERAERTEKERQLLKETFDDFLDAGFFRIVQPRRFGGYEFDTETLARTMLEIARGCPASGWTLCLTAGHTLLLAQFPEEVQRDAFGPAGDFRSSWQAFPGGKAVAVDGGYRVSGAWNYTSGCDHTNYFCGNVIVASEKKGPPTILAPLMPMTNAKIVDNWESMGMRGTGSKQVVFKEEFVATEWAPVTGEMLSTGSGTHDNPLYHGPFLPFFMIELASVAVGTARGTLDAFREFAPTKILKNARRLPATEDVTTRQKFAEATSLCDVAEGALMEVSRQYMRLGAQFQSGEVDRTPETTNRLMLPLQQILRICAEVTDTIFMASGTSATLGNHALQRYFRDMSMIRTHVLANLEARGDQWAASHFGVEPYYPLG